MRARRILFVLAAAASLLASGAARAVPVQMANPTVGAGPVAADYNPVLKAWYVANLADDTVSVVAGAGALDPAAPPMPKRLALFHELQRIAVADAPSGVAVHDGTGSVYVSSAGADVVSEITANRVVATIGGMSSPQGVAVDSASNKMCVAALGENKVWIVNTTDRSIAAKVAVNAGPVGVVAGNGFCYVTSYYAGTVQKISLATNGIVATGIAAPGTFASCPNGLALSPSGALLYVANECHGSLSYLYTSSLAIVFNQALGSGSKPAGVAASAKQVYVAESGSNQVTAWNPIDPSATPKLTLPAGVQPRGMAMGVDTGSECAAASNYLSESVTLYCEA